MLERQRLTTLQTKTNLLRISRRGTFWWWRFVVAIKYKMTNSTFCDLLWIKSEFNRFANHCILFLFTFKQCPKIVQNSAQEFKTGFIKLQSTSVQCQAFPCQWWHIPEIVVLKSCNSVQNQTLIEQKMFCAFLND